MERWTTPGDYHQWAEASVVESVREAWAAYEGVVFQEAEVGRNGKLKVIRVRLPEGYEREQVERAADQVAKGGRIWRGC